MNKGILGVITSTVLATTLLPSGAGAQTDYNYDQVSPYMHYAGDDSGTSTPYEAELTNLNIDSEYRFSLEEIDENGNFVREFTRWTFTNTETESISHNFGNINGEGFPYRLRDRQTGETVMKGFTAEAPSEDFRSSGDYRGNFQAVGIGDVVYNSGLGLLHDNTEPNLGIVKQGDYEILHYRFPFGSEDYSIELYNENTDSVEATFEYNDIVDFQGDDGSDHRRSFVILNTGGDVLDFVDDRAYDSSIFDEGDNPFNMNLSHGLYTYASFDDTGSQRATGETFLGVSTSDVEWELDPARNIVREGYLMTWTVTRNTEEIAEVFDDHTLVDGSMQKDFGSELDTWQRETAIKYKIDPVFEEDDDYTTFWYFKPSEDLAYDISPSQVEGEQQENITVRAFQGLQDNVEQLLETVGLDDAVGKIFFAVLGIIGVTFVMAFYGANFIVTGISAFGMVAVFTMMGFIPLWFIMTVIMLGVAGLMMLFKGGD